MTASAEKDVPRIDPVAILIAKTVAKTRMSGVLDAAGLARQVRALIAEETRDLPPEGTDS